MFLVFAHGGALEYAAGLRAHVFGPEPRKPAVQQADRHPLEGRDQAGRAEVGDAGTVVQEAGDLFEADRYQERAEDGADVVAPAAHDDGGEPDDRFGREPYGRRHDLDVADTG